MSSKSPNEAEDMEGKLGWLAGLIKQVGLPVALCLIFAGYLAFKVDNKLEEVMNEQRRSNELSRKFLQQVCVNTAPDAQTRYQCWTIY